jgi:hypothetical protein
LRRKVKFGIEAASGLSIEHIPASPMFAADLSLTLASHPLERA